MVTVSSQTYATVFNKLDRPVHIDGPGHLLGGREYGSVNVDTAEVKKLLASGALLTVQDPGGDLDGKHEGAVAAFLATRKANGEPEQEPADDAAPAKAAPKRTAHKAADESDEKGA